jgi:hypothetical protein
VSGNCRDAAAAAAALLFILLLVKRLSSRHEIFVKIKSRLFGAVSSSLSLSLISLGEEERKKKKQLRRTQDKIKSPGTSGYNNNTRTSFFDKM